MNSHENTTNLTMPDGFDDPQFVRVLGEGSYARATLYTVKDTGPCSGTTSRKPIVVKLPNPRVIAPEQFVDEYRQAGAAQAGKLNRLFHGRVERVLNAADGHVVTEFVEGTGMDKFVDSLPRTAAGAGTLSAALSSMLGLRESLKRVGLGHFDINEKNLQVAIGASGPRATLVDAQGMRHHDENYVAPRSEMLRVTPAFSAPEAVFNGTTRAESIDGYATGMLALVSALRFSGQCDEAGNVAISHVLGTDPDDPLAVMRWMTVARPKARARLMAKATDLAPEGTRDVIAGIVNFANQATQAEPEDRPQSVNHALGLFKRPTNKTIFS